MHGTWTATQMLGAVAVGLGLGCGAVAFALASRTAEAPVWVRSWTADLMIFAVVLMPCGAAVVAFG